MRRAGAVWAMAIACAFPVAAEEAAVYRWTDRDGRVNYGSTPPAGVKATVLQGSGRVSVVPAIAVPPVPQAALPSDVERLERLERALEEEREQRRERAEEELEREARGARLRADCEEKYREPCDAYGQPAGPRYIVVPTRPPHRPPGGRDGRIGDDRPRPRPPAYGERSNPRPSARTGPAMAGSDRAPQRRSRDQPARSGEHRAVPQ